MLGTSSNSFYWGKMSVKVWLHCSGLYTKCVFPCFYQCCGTSMRGAESWSRFWTSTSPLWSQPLRSSVFLWVSCWTKPHFSIIIAAFSCALFSEKVSRIQIWHLPSASALLLNSLSPKWYWTCIFADQKVCRRHHPPRSRQSRWVSRSLVIWYEMHTGEI